MAAQTSGTSEDPWSRLPDETTKDTIWEHPGRVWTEKDRIEAKVTNAEKYQERYLRGALLGAGGWSKVYKVRRVADGKIFAGKSCRTLRLLKKEAQILKSMDHEHILRFVDWEETLGAPDDILLVMELCVGGTVQQRIDSTTQGLPGREVLDILWQVASALEYLHLRGQFHSDVKPRNIMLRSVLPLHAILGDCADIKDVRNIPSSPPRGTPAYLSPEILRRNRCCGTKDDMWALGITLLGLIGQWPQMDFTKEGMKKYPKKCHGHVVKLMGLNPGDEIVEELLVRLVEWDPSKRMDALTCRRRALEMQDSGRWGDEKVKLNVPDEFKPISFW